MAGLPTADLTETHMPRFLFARISGTPVGMIGLEEYGDCGLLRSLVVTEACRGSGVGAQLVAGLESQAAQRGLRSLWLLTIDADSYFERLGYATTSRDQAPQGIQNSAEFSSLCPGDAVLMHKQLATG